MLYGMGGSSGISSDLKQGKAIAKRAVAEYGMGPRTGLNIPDSPDKLNPTNEQDIDEIIRAAGQVADLIAQFHKPFIEEYRDSYKEIKAKAVITFQVKNLMNVC